MRQHIPEVHARIPKISEDLVFLETLKAEKHGWRGLKASDAKVDEVLKSLSNKSLSKSLMKSK